MADEVAYLKGHISQIEIVINEIDMDMLKEVNPQYLKKLEKIQKLKGIKFKSAEEFDAYFSD
jgi:hypothetical protein